MSGLADVTTKNYGIVVGGGVRVSVPVGIDIECVCGQQDGEIVPLALSVHIAV